MKRVKSLDFLKFFCIFLVCLTHSIQKTYGMENALNEPVYNLVVAFNMPLFMIIAVFFSQSSLTLPFCSFLKRKSLLLIPVVASYLVFLIGSYFIAGTIGRPKISSCGYFLWFLTSTIACYLILWITLRCFKNIYLAMLVALIGVWGCRYINYCYISFMLPYFCSGIILRKNIDLINKIKMPLFLLLVALSILSLLSWDASNSLYAVPIQFVSFHSFDLDNLCAALYSFFVGLVVSLTFVIFAFKCENILGRKSLSFCLNIGQKTLGIYVLQKFTLELLFCKLYIIIPQDIVIYAAWVLAAFECTFCYWIVINMEKNKILAFLFLGKPLKQALLPKGYAE